MASQALTDFLKRLDEVQQLVDAHGALVRLKKAEATLHSGGQQLQNVAAVVQHLVSPPGPGRPPEVQALNSAGVALLSAHLQGFFVDLFKEAARTTLDGKVKNLDAVTESTNTRGNPNEQNITRMFKSIGYPNILDDIAWKNMSNRSLRIKLRSFNELRNKIVHGADASVTKAKLTNYLNVLTNFAQKFDGKLFREVRSVTGADPWQKE